MFLARWNPDHVTGRISWIATLGLDPAKPEMT